MIGAAAGRHLAEAGVNAALIGPGEPRSVTETDGPFASHWDAGRITRLASRSNLWAALARRSIDRYADIEARSGLKFHTPRGVACSVENPQEWVDFARANGGEAEIISAAELRARSGIALPTDGPVTIEGAPGGWINPRVLVEAETQLAEAAGAFVVRNSVTSVTGSVGKFAVAGPWGSVRSHRVLLATGAFGAELIGRRVQLRRLPRTVVLAEFDDNRIPSLILAEPSHPDLKGIYWVPPTEYPNGRRYLKIGAESPTVEPVNADELREWFHAGGSAVEVQALQESVVELLPEVDVQSWRSQPCVVSFTASEHPYIGWAEEGIAIAVGGNGHAAKSCDEIGRLAGLFTAQHVLGGETWPDAELQASEFAPAFEASRFEA